MGPGDELYAYTEDLEALAARLKREIQELKIDVLLSHGSNGEYGHPAHRISHQAARAAVAGMGAEAPLFYTVAAIFPGHPRERLANADDPADLVLDITPVLEQKTKAALCHSTQHALFIRRASEEAGHRVTVPEVIATLESLHRVSPPGRGGPLEEVLASFRTVAS